MTRTKDNPSGPDRRTLLAGIAASVAVLPAGAQSPAPLQMTLKAEPTRSRLRQGEQPETPTLGFNGMTPGPVIRVKRGQPATIRFENGLNQPSALHFRGLRGPNAADGVPGLTQAAVPPGGHHDHVFTPTDAGTFLYHAFGPGLTAEQVERGLSGMLIVEEEVWTPVDHEAMVLLDDWRLLPDGTIDPGFANVPDRARLGRFGNTLTVNGRAGPEVVRLRPRARVRVRIGGVMNARILPMRFEKMAKATVIAIDGQPCDPFDPLRRQVLVAPGSRYDVVLDLPEKAGEETLVTVALGDGLTVVRFLTEGEPLPVKGEVPPLPPNNLPPGIRLQEARRAEFNIAGGWDGEGDLPGQPTDPARIQRKFPDPSKIWTLNFGFPSGVTGKPLFSVRRGQVAVVALVNRSRWMQVIALHGHVARVLHPLDDGWEPYFMDTIIVPEGRTVRVAFIADNPGKWLIRSAVLEHMESGVMAWYEVSA
jgi:FtsP/CotA-like multicopper oxidase with cupredoxin domain